TNLFARALPWTVMDLENLLTNKEIGGLRSHHAGGILRPLQRFVDQGNRLTPVMEQAIRALQGRLISSQGAEDRKLLIRVNALLGAEKSVLPTAGETWA